MGAMTNTTAAAWKEVGRRLEEARLGQRPPMSKRAAARKAGVSDVTYRQLAEGERQVAPGMKVPVSPKDENFARVAYAVGLDPRPLFDLVGRTWRAELAEVSEDSRKDAIERRLDRMDDQIREILERLEANPPESGDG